MPIFEYRCGKCEKDFEKLVLSSQTKPPVCPECGSKKVTQQLSRFSSSGSAGGRPARACASGAPT